LGSLWTDFQRVGAAIVLRRPTTAVISNSDASYLMPSDVVSALLEVYHDDDILCVQTEPNGDFAVTFS
jgi:hypothetical protein